MLTPLQQEISKLREDEQIIIRNTRSQRTMTITAECNNKTISQMITWHELQTSNIDLLTFYIEKTIALLRREPLTRRL